MTRLVFSDILSGFNSAETLNLIMGQVETAFDRVLFKDGTSPNAMGADLDMGGFRILNTGHDDDPNSLPTYQQVVDYVDSKASGLVAQKYERIVATNAQTVFNLTTMAFNKDTNNLAVYVNGVRKFLTADYTETDNDTVTFNVGLATGDKVDFFSNEYLATVSIPLHQHTWSQITNPPVYTTRWPTWDEVTGKPSTFTPASHTHSAADITSGTLADARRGVYVQAAQPLDPVVGALWLW